MNIGFVDIHSHILPGVDDGAKNMEEAIKMLTMAYEQGVRTIVTTPHFAISRRAASNSNEKAMKTKQAFETFQEEVNKIYPEMTVVLGNELFYTDGVVEAVKDGRARTMGDTQYVLVEFSPSIPYKELYRAVRDLVAARYRPIIAHVERYECLENQWYALEELRELGVYYQMNSASLLGFALNKEVRRCRKLVKEGYISFIGSDMHNCTTRAPRMDEAAAWVEKHCGETLTEKIFGGNATKALANEYI